MTFPASGVLPARAFDEIRQTAVTVKQTCTNYINTASSQNVDYDFIKAILFALNRANDRFNQLRTTPGLAAYAKAQVDDPNFDIAAEFSAMQSAITGALDWAATNIPTNVTLKPTSQWDSGSIVSGSFTPAQTAGLRSVLQSVVDTIS